MEGPPAKKFKKNYEYFDENRGAKAINISVNFETDSHGKPHRHLPRHVNSSVTDKRFTIPASFNYSSKITLAVVERILEDVNTRWNQPQVIVTILGGNNLRNPGLNPPNDQTPHGVAELFRNLLEGCSKVPKCWVIIVGLIPDAGNQECKDRFIEAGRHLRNISKGFKSMCSYLDPRGVFFKNGNILNELYDINDGYHGVHLNSLGAEVLAKNIHKHMKTIPNKFFL